VRTFRGRSGDVRSLDLSTDFGRTGLSPGCMARGSEEILTRFFDVSAAGRSCVELPEGCEHVHRLIVVAFAKGA